MKRRSVGGVVAGDYKKAKGEHIGGDVKVRVEDKVRGTVV